MKQTFRDKLISEIRQANPKKSKSWLKQQVEYIDIVLKGLKRDA
jgi:hypothetical protein